MNIKDNERAVFIGKTGSGKSHLMRKFCSQFDRVVFIDPKHENFELPATLKTHSIEEIFQEMKKPTFFIVFQPIRWDEDEFNRLCEGLFYIGDFRLFLDEIHLKPVEWHRTLIRAGRSKGIGMFHICQRPIFIDNFVLSESEHFFLFHLQMDKPDKDKIAGIVGQEVFEAYEKLEEHEFIYYSAREGMKLYKPVK